MCGGREFECEGRSGERGWCTRRYPESADEAALVPVRGGMSERLGCKRRCHVTVLFEREERPVMKLREE